MAANRRLEVKLPERMYSEVQAAAKQRGFNSANAFVRAAITTELRSGDSALARTEEVIGQSVDCLAREVRALHGAQQATFALADSLVRLFLTCVPEPPPDVIEESKRRAQLRYRRFLKTVAANMTGEPSPLLNGDHGDE